MAPASAVSIQAPVAGIEIDSVLKFNLDASPNLKTKKSLMAHYEALAKLSDMMVNMVKENANPDEMGKLDQIQALVKANICQLSSIPLRD